MRIEEVAEILGVSRFLGAPKYVLITDEPVYEEMNGRRYFRGLQPSGRDAIFLSTHADVTTVPHETWHSQTGLGELTAYLVGNAVALKYRLLNSFPLVREALSRQLIYREVESAPEFPNLSQYRGRVRLFKLEQ